MIWILHQVSLILGAFSIVLLIVFQILKSDLAVGQSVCYRKVPSEFLVFFVSLPVVYQFYIVAHSADVMVQIVAGKHAILRLVEGVKMGLHAWRRVVERKIIVLHQISHIFLGALLIDCLFPDAKNIN